MTHFNNLKPEELERLAILAEECSEVIQIVNKIIRHGYESYNPFDEGKTTNRQLLEKELGHVEHIVGRMTASDLDRATISSECNRKGFSILQYLHHQG